MARVVRIHEYGGPEVLQLDDVEAASPGPREVSLHVRAIGINRAEIAFRQGVHFESANFPARIGYEAAGIVTAVGGEVDDIRVGDRVSLIPLPSITQWGTYGDWVNVPAEHVLQHPAALTFEQGAAMWMAHLTAYGALIDAGHLRAGETVLVTGGSSSVGLAAISIGHALGATMIVSTRNASKREALYQAGADEVIVTADWPLVERITALTGNRGVDLVLDSVAGTHLSEAVASARLQGRIVVLGALAGPQAKISVPTIIGNRLTIRGFSFKEVVAEQHVRKRALEFLQHGMATGSLQAPGHTSVPLESVVDAHRLMESGKHVGKIVLAVDGGPG